LNAFILIDAEAFSFLISSLFVAAALFAMQSLGKAPPIFNFWSVAIAIGGFRYLAANLVSVIGLSFTVILLDVLLLAQAALMLGGCCCLQNRPTPKPLIAGIAAVLLIWGMATSQMADNWLWHDIPILTAFAAAMITSGVMFVTRKVRKSDTGSLQTAVAGLIIASGLLYFFLLFVSTESNLDWFFVVEQSFLIVLGVVLISGILSNLQTQMQFVTKQDRITGAYTINYFSHLLNTELHRAQRYQRPFSYIQVVIDASDENIHVSEQLSRAIVKSLRSVDFIGKVSDSEFVIALPETALDEARHVAERQLTQAKDVNAQHRDIADIAIRVVLSHSEPGDNADRIYARSNNAMTRLSEPNSYIISNPS